MTTGCDLHPPPYEYMFRLHKEESKYHRKAQYEHGRRGIQNEWGYGHTYKLNTYTVKMFKTVKHIPVTSLVAVGNTAHFKRAAHPTMTWKDPPHHFQDCSNSQSLPDTCRGQPQSMGRNLTIHSLCFVRTVCNNYSSH